MTLGDKWVEICGVVQNRINRWLFGYSDEVRERVYDGTQLACMTHQAKEFDTSNHAEAYIATIARNMRVSVMRELNRRPESVPYADEFNQSADQELRHMLASSVSEHVLSKLNERDARLVRRRYIDGVPPRGLTTEFDLSVEQISQRLKIIKRQLNRYRECDDWLDDKLDSFFESL